MANLLGATNPIPGYDNAAINRNTGISPGSAQIQNVTDPSRVTGPDGRTEQQDNSSMANSGQIRYDSNFHTFLQRLRENSNLAPALTRLFAGREGIVVHSGMSEGIAEELAQVLEMLHMDKAQLLDFLTSQSKSGTKFSGALFALLRNAYARASSENVRSDILKFLQSYLDYASTRHIEGNLLRNLAGMADSIPASWAEKLRELTAQVQNGIAAGDRQGVLQLLQRQVLPYMSNYVKQTHDIGTARALLTLLALDMTRYENGSTENLLQTFHQLAGYGTLRNQLGQIDDQSLLQLLEKNLLVSDSPASRFSDHLAAAAARALRGEGNAEMQEIFRQLVSAILINESVYMPVNHYLLPLEWDGHMLFSEMWVDPNAEEKEQQRDEPHGSTMKLLFKIDVQAIGLFDIVLTHQAGNVELMIACPEKVVPFSRQIEKAVSTILTNNGLSATGITVRKMERPLTLSEVFPKIFEGKNSINVKV